MSLHARKSGKDIPKKIIKKSKQSTFASSANRPRKSMHNRKRDFIEHSVRRAVFEYNQSNGEKFPEDLFDECVEDALKKDILAYNKDCLRYFIKNHEERQMQVIDENISEIKHKESGLEQLTSDISKNFDTVDLGEFVTESPIEKKITPYKSGYKKGDKIKINLNLEAEIIETPKKGGQGEILVVNLKNKKDDDRKYTKVLKTALKKGDQEEKNKELEEALKQEADTMSQLVAEPGSVPISVPPIELKEGESGILMDYVQGSDLENILKAYTSRTTLPPHEGSAFIVDRILKHMVKAHKLGIAHRDLCKRNVRYACPGTIKILDFGASKSELETIGKPLYLSPEGIKNAIDEKKFELDRFKEDSYSIGVILYEMLTGINPNLPRKLNKDESGFYDTRDTITAILNFRQSNFGKKLISPNDICPDIPESLSRVVMALMDENPNNRADTETALNMLQRDHEYNGNIGSFGITEAVFEPWHNYLFGNLLNDFGNEFGETDLINENEELKDLKILLLGKYRNIIEQKLKGARENINNSLDFILESHDDVVLFLRKLKSSGEFISRTSELDNMIKSLELANEDIDEIKKVKLQKAVDLEYLENSGLINIDYSLGNLERTMYFAYYGCLDDEEKKESLFEKVLVDYYVNEGIDDYYNRCVEEWKNNPEKQKKYSEENLERWKQSLKKEFKEANKETLFDTVSNFINLRARSRTSSDQEADELKKKIMVKDYLVNVPIYRD